jgi:hypothetical protein
VLRQTLIALRLAERAGLDEETRADVHYTALLISVGCHATRTSRRSGSATTSS